MVSKREVVMTKKKFDLQAVQQAMQLISGKWKIPILITLRVYGEMRFGQLQENVQGIGSKMLSKELKELEGSGLVLREVTSTSPVRIHYSLSVYGKTLDEVFETLSNWGAMHKIENKEEKHSINHHHIIDI